MTMSCGFDKGLIAAHYDGETTPAERAEVERHLASCPECARELASMKDLSAALKPLAGATAPMSVAEGVMRGIAPVRASRRVWIQWAASAAAAVLLAVGTLYLLDRRAPPVKLTETAKLPDVAPAKAPPATRQAPKGRVQQDRPESLSKGFGAPVETPSAPPPAPPGAEPRADDDAVAGAKKEEDNSRMLLDKSKKPAVPVLKVTAPDPAVIRAEVAAFLKERELKAPAVAPVLGRTAFARARYVELDLTDEESEALEKRLAALKGIEVAPGSLEDEQKRVAEEMAKNRVGADAEKSAAEVLKPESKDRARGAAGDRGPERRKFILVLETPPAAKK